MSTTPTETQISSGGVAFRQRDHLVEIALISVGAKPRWQLPKGLVDNNESTEQTAVREVREEAGIETELVALIDKIEYWYYGQRRGQRLRYHKYVYFYLLRYRAGDVRDHDHEVNEARWVEISQAQAMLAFTSERKVVEQAKKLIDSYLIVPPSG